MEKYCGDCLSKGCTSFRDLGILGLSFRGPSQGLRSSISRLQAAMRVSLRKHPFLFVARPQRRRAKEKRMLSQAAMKVRKGVFREP